MKLEELVNDWRTIDKRQNELLKEVDSELDFHDGGLATPTETARLMGMQDHQFDKQIQVTSNAQAYKQHGNGIVAQVIGMIIGMMWYENENELRNKVMANSHTWIKEKEKK